MTRFITLKSAGDKRDIHMNVAHIVTVFDDGKGIGTGIVPTTGHTIRVDDTVDEILTMIAAVA